MSEVRLSELESSKRLDSEYYKKEYLNIENSINSNKCYHLSELADFLIGPFGSAFDTANYVENGYFRYVRGQDVKPFILKDDDCRYIPESDYKRLFKYSLKEKDVLVSVVGTLGNACIVQKKDIPAIFSCKSTVIRAKKINPVVLLTYLNCEYGRKLLLRKERGAIQKGLNLDDLRTLLIPQFEENISNQIEAMFYKAQNKLEESKLLYSEAEDILLSELGLKDWKPKNENVSIKHFSDFFETGRLDAEYYQSKYDEFNEKLYKNPSLKCVLAEEVCSDINYGTVPTSPYTTDGTGIPYIKGMNLKNTEILTDNLDRITNTGELPDKFYTEKGDIIISQMGTVADVGVVTENEVGYLFASFTIRLRLKKDCLLQPYYVGLYIQKVAKEWYFYRNIAQASVRQNTDLPTVRNLPIPIISETAQNLIAEKIQKSFDLRKQSKDLLEQAKRMVENEIEKVNIS